MRALLPWLLLLLTWPAVAQPKLPPGTVPKADVQGIRDVAAVPRYAGSVLLGGSSAAFDELVFANAPLVRVAAKHDARNNALFMPPAPLRVEGRRTRLVYLIPEGRSPLEVVRGYQQALTAAGGERLFECADAECGGNATNGASAGGNSTGLAQLMMPVAEVPSAGQPVQCATDIDRVSQRYALLALPKKGGHVAVLSSVLGDVSAGSECKRWVGRTVAVVNVVEVAARQQNMEVVSASNMSQALTRDGRIALYAIQFDTGKSDLKPESGAQVGEMAELLRTNAAMKVMIVGHTDNQGSLDSNMDLSKRRAASVVAALAQRGIAAARMVPQGVGMAAPLASNAAEDGRARNRRVELVPQ